VRSSLHLYLGLAIIIGLPAFGQRYSSPNLTEKVFDISKLSLSTVERMQLADELAAFARNGHVTDPQHMSLARKALAIALRLDPVNKKAMVADMQMSRGLEVTGIDTKHPGLAFSGFLMSNVAKLKDGSDDVVLRGYLVSMASEIDARNEDAIYQAALMKRKKETVDWVRLLDGAPKQTEAAEGGEISRLNPAYQNREKEFVRRQSSI
jgi:hypothetical protein